MLAAEALAYFDDLPVNRSEIEQSALDLTNRVRRSVFSWRGQFSPELVSLLLSEYGADDCLVLDPFVGSGTVLFEAARSSMGCIGAEINPAAVMMANTVSFAAMGSDKRMAAIDRAEAVIMEHVPVYHGLPLFDGGSSEYTGVVESIVSDSMGESRPVQVILFNSIMMSRDGDVHSIIASFRRYCGIVRDMPYSDRLCCVLHEDARRLSIEDGVVDLVVTSPPYINVFNYHQNYRHVMEMMGWDPLTIARSEIGSNRKYRSNRFLTVIQYVLDMYMALVEMRRVLNPSGRAILVVGRESRVRGVRFRNGRIVASLAMGGAGFELVMRQERKFKNRFGVVIYEDVLHLIPGATAGADDFPMALAGAILEEKLSEPVPETVKDDIRMALERMPEVAPSPIFDREKAYVNRGAYTSPGQAGSCH